MYVLRSDIQCVICAKTRASSDGYFLVYDSALIREKHESEKSRISVYFTQWIERDDSFF